MDNGDTLASFQGSTKGGRMTPDTITLTERWTITDGPSREELFDSLRLRNEYRTVEFELFEPSVDEDGEGLMRAPYKVRVKAQVLQIGAEDGSGHSWCVKVAFQSDKRIVVTNEYWIDIYYHDAGNGGRGGRRGGTIIDAQPNADRLHVDRNGDVWRGSHRIGNVQSLSSSV